MLVKKHEKVDLKHCNDLKAFIDYTNDMQHVYKNIKEYNPRIKCRVLVIFDKMIADMISKKNLTQSD